MLCLLSLCLSFVFVFVFVVVVVFFFVLQWIAFLLPVFLPKLLPLLILPSPPPAQRNRVCEYILAADEVTCKLGRGGEGLDQEAR